MLLKKIIKEGETHSYYESSNIIKSIYQPQNTELIIIFKNGSSYKYSDVNEGDFTTFEMANSQGAIHNKIIKNKPFIKGSLVDIEECSKELQELNNIDDNNTKELIILKMRDALAVDKESQLFDQHLIDLRNTIKFYFNNKY